MKKVILLIMVLIISGCSVEYKAIIGSDTITEEVLFSESIKTLPVSAFIDEQASSLEYNIIDGLEYYKADYTSPIDYLSYKFNTSDYNRSRAANTCLSSVKLSQDEGVYIINTSNEFNCMDLYYNLDNIKISLVLDSNIYEMVSNNADYTSASTYTWNINRDNYKNKYIQLRYKKKKEEQTQIIEEPKEEEQQKEGLSIFKLIALVCILLLFFIGLIGLIKYKSIPKN